MPPFLWATRHNAIATSDTTNAEKIRTKEARPNKPNGESYTVWIAI
jgi:hypothetical protein